MVLFKKQNVNIKNSRLFLKDQLDNEEKETPGLENLNKCKHFIVYNQL